LKIRSILGIASVILQALTASLCSDDDKVSGLEELPKEIAANLKVVPNTDLLISVPPFEAKKPVVAPAPKNCAPTELSYVQVIYPFTICSHPDFSTNGLLKEFRAASDRAPLPAPAGETQTHMLSSFEGKSLKKTLLVQHRIVWRLSEARCDLSARRATRILNAFGARANASPLRPASCRTR